jgi:hypothetical protein
MYIDSDTAIGIRIARTAGATRGAPANSAGPALAAIGHIAQNNDRGRTHK